jgi:hypothetical protein
MSIGFFSTTAIMGSIDTTQKAQLHQVADLMFEIYQTLVRMQYLDSSWIHKGPHNIEALLPLYYSLDLDPAVIYLYSILPYVDTHDALDVDFFHGSYFADFRKKEDIERGRDPLYDQGEEGGGMQPWMTPLSMLGNHRSVILYDTRKHVIGIIDQESGCSTDHNLYERVTAQEANESRDEVHEGYGEGKDNVEMTEEERSAGDEEDQDGEDEEGEDEDEEDDKVEGLYDEMDSRPADRVLRDIIKWYHELVEMPGGGESCTSGWDEALVKPLYIKYGWPSAKFDGRAFLVAQVRIRAAQDAKYYAEEPLQQVKRYEGWIEDVENPQALHRKGALAAAKSVEEEWSARWELFWAGLLQKSNLVNRKREQHKAELACPGGQCQNVEELPLWELRQLEKELWSWERQLKHLQEQTKEMETIGPMEDSRIVFKLRYTEQRVSVYQQAFEACQDEAERLCPGKRFFHGAGVKESGIDLEERIKSLTEGLELSQSRAKAVREWIVNLPEGVRAARIMAQSQLEKQEDYVETLEGQRRGCTQELEKL